MLCAKHYYNMRTKIIRYLLHIWVLIFLSHLHDLPLTINVEFTMSLWLLLHPVVNWWSSLKLTNHFLSLYFMSSYAITFYIFDRNEDGQFYASFQRYWFSNKLKTWMYLQVMRKYRCMYVIKVYFLRALHINGMKPMYLHTFNSILLGFT